MLFYVNMKPGWDDDRAMLRMTLTKNENAEGDNHVVFMAPELAVYLKVRARTWWIVAIVSILAFGTFLTSLEKEALQSLLEFVMPAARAAIWGKSAILWLKGLGSALIAIGAFLGFRKLPGPSGG
jgi:hypothetical protein